MKEQLGRENIEALAAYRFQRAEETLSEIPFLKQQGYYNTAVNRLYYACYYAAVALLIKHDINPGTHAGVKQMLGMHFVATGRMSREMGRCFSLLFERRHSSDYDDFAYSSAEEIDELLPKAEAFIDTVRKLLQELIGYAGIMPSFKALHFSALWDTCIPFMKHKHGSRAVLVLLASRASVPQTGNK